MSLQVTLTSLDIPFAMFAPKNLELEGADPMVSPPLTKVSSETGRLIVLPGRVPVSPRTVSLSAAGIAASVGSLQKPRLLAETGTQCPEPAPAHLCLVLMQVNPPDSPETASPLQGSLHSDGSSGGSSGNTHDDFVMIDFVSCCRLLRPLLSQGTYLGHRCT